MTCGSLSVCLYHVGIRVWIYILHGCYVYFKYANFYMTCILLIRVPAYLRTHACTHCLKWVHVCAQGADFTVISFLQCKSTTTYHDDVIKWKHFPRNWPFVRGIHRSRWIPRTKASDAELLMFSLICVWINDWVNNREAGDVRRYRGHYDVIVMCLPKCLKYMDEHVSYVPSEVWFIFQRHELCSGLF